MAKMNYCTIIIFVVFGYIASFVTIDARNEGLFLGKYPIRSLKPAPMDIVTSKVKEIDLSPLQINITLNEKMDLTNNADSVQGAIQLGTRSTLTGGPYENRVYNYHMVQYYWSGNTTGPSATTIDGKNGSPIEVITYWYNRDYGSIMEAIKYRNGLAVVSSLLNVGTLFNEQFTPFLQTLKKIRKPASTVKIDHKIAFDWYDKFTENTTYYAYPACEGHSLTGNRLFCATICIFKPIIPALNLGQFKKSFLSLMDRKGKPLTNSHPSFPQAGTPVVQAVGLHKNYGNWP